MNSLLSFKEYMIKSMLYFLISFCLFEGLFISIPSYTYLESLLLFVVVSLSVFLVGIYSGKNTYKTVFENILLAWVIFLCITHDFLIFMLLILIIAIVIYVIMMTNGTSEMMVMKTVARYIFYSSSLFFLVILVTCFINKNAQSMVVSTVGYTEADSINNNIGEIAKLEESKWGQLSDEEKIRVCEKIVNAEGLYYGLPFRIDVETEELSTEILALYNPYKRTIVLNSACLDDSFCSFELVPICCHEVYHAFTAELVSCYTTTLSDAERNLLYFQKIGVYKEEMENYNTDIGNVEDYFLNYYFITMEVDARAAEERSLIYFDQISQYYGLDIDSSRFSNCYEYIKFYQRLTEGE